MRTSSPARAAVRHRLLRGVVAVAVVALAASTVSGCAANFGAQTNQQYQPAIGVSDREGDVYVIHTLVVADGQGNGTVVSALINQTDEPDQLETVEAKDSAGVALTVDAPSGTTLPSHQAVQLAAKGDVRVSGESVQPGMVLTLTFSFAQGEPVEIEAPVVANSEVYADVPVGPAGSAGPTESTTSD